MKELEKEIERVKKVIENYEKEFDELKPSHAKATLNEVLIKSRGVLLGLQKAKMFLEIEGK